MNTAVLFANTGVLDFLELRSSIVRIPEVIHYLKRAQVFLDRAMDEAPDLIQFVVSEDHVFWKSEKIRKIAVGVVQVALYERYTKKFGRPNFILSANSLDCAIKVVSGEMRLGEYVIQLAMTEEKPVAKSDQELESLPGSFLSRGISMPEFYTFSYQKTEGSEEENLKPMSKDKKVLSEGLQELREEYGIQHFVNIGPGQSISGNAHNELLDRELNIRESVDLDPMLSWFWDISAAYSYQIAN